MAVLQNPAPGNISGVSVNTFMTTDWLELLDLSPIKTNSMEHRLTLIICLEENIINTVRSLRRFLVISHYISQT